MLILFGESVSEDHGPTWILVKMGEPKGESMRVPSSFLLFLLLWGRGEPKEVDDATLLHASSNLGRF